MANEQVIKPRIFKGTRDFLPEEMVQRERIITTLKNIFSRYGYQPMETPSIEYLEILTGKYGEEGDKLIYPLAYKGGKELALRYDLTVPLSRVVAMYPHMPKPFKRYQIQPVWRADQPQLVRGRYREFYQCDADTIGSTSLIVDAEIIALTYNVLKALGFQDFVIRINSRKVLTGIIEMTGLSDGMESTICRSLDKLEKIGETEVKKELKEKELPDAAIDTLWNILNVQGTVSEILSHLENNPKVTGKMSEALKEIRELFNYIESFEIPEASYRWDLHLARGLDYYTGPIYESVLPKHPHIGSLTGGGRYDHLIGMFLGQDVPAAGTTIGLDRIFTALQQLNLLEGSKSSVQIMVCRFSENETSHNIKITQMLRDAGFNVELYPDTDKLGKQFGFADKKGIPLVIVQGPDEVINNIVTVKDLRAGSQKQVAVNELIGYMKQVI